MKNFNEMINSSLKNQNFYEKRIQELSDLRNFLKTKIYTLEEVLEWYDSFEKDKYKNVFNVEEFTTEANYTKSYASNNWKTKESITFDFDIINTMFGGKRLCIKEKSSVGYITNWCFGHNMIELKRCLDWIKTLDEWTIINFRICSKSKPLQYDQEFCLYLKTKGFEINPNSIKNLLNLEL